MMKFVMIINETSNKSTVWSSRARVVVNDERRTVQLTTMRMVLLAALSVLFDRGHPENKVVLLLLLLLIFSSFFFLLLFIPAS